MSKGSAFTRVIAYFRTADLTEATSCLQAATEVLVSRSVPETPAKRSYTRRTRQAGPTAPPTHGEAAQGATA